MPTPRLRLRRLLVCVVAAAIGCGDSTGPTVPDADPDRQAGQAPNTKAKSKRNKGDAVRQPQSNLLD